MSKPGFSLLDLTTVLGVTFVFALLSLQLIAVERQRANNNKCRNKLRQIALSMNVFADMDPKGRFSSGAPDYCRDGCPDTWGWIADYVNSGLADANGIYCDASRAKGGQYLNQVLALKPGDQQVLSPGDRAKDGICGSRLFPLTKTSGSAKTDFFSGTEDSSSQRSELIARWFLDKSYNSNYTASWVLVRSQPRLETNKGGFASPVRKGKLNFTTLQATYGPLTLRMMDAGYVPASTIPFVGCGSEWEQAKTGFSHDSDRHGFFKNGKQKATSFFDKGDGLVATMTFGPIYWDPRQESVVLPNARDFDFANTVKEESGAKAKKAESLRQDTRQWYAWHSVNGERFLNLAMGDGSVKSLQDLNGDGYLNPGFPVKKSKGMADRNRYTNEKSEVQAKDLFTGVFIYLPPKSRFE